MTDPHCSTDEDLSERLGDIRLFSQWYAEPHPDTTAMKRRLREYVLNGLLGGSPPTVVQAVVNALETDNSMGAVNLLGPILFEKEYQDPVIQSAQLCLLWLFAREVQISAAVQLLALIEHYHRKKLECEISEDTNLEINLRDSRLRAVARLCEKVCLDVFITIESDGNEHEPSVKDATTGNTGNISLKSAAEQIALVFQGPDDFEIVEDVPGDRSSFHIFEGEEPAVDLTRLPYPVAQEPEPHQASEPSLIIEQHAVLGAKGELLDQARNEIRDIYPWLTDIVDQMFRRQNLRERAKEPILSFPATLLVGPPGSGKTSFAKQIANSAGLPVWYVSAAGKTGAVEIMGSAANYAGSSPSVGVNAMNKLRCLNPVIIIDEIDKFGESRQLGDPLGALATMVEKNTAKDFVDDYLNEPVDLSNITWLMTANSIETIRGPLLDRLDIYHVRRPGSEHFEAVYRQMLNHIASELNIYREHLPTLEPEIVNAIRAGYAKGCSLRRLKTAITRSLEIAASFKPN